MAEWTKFDSRSFLGVDTGWYLSGGYRVANVTPYLTYSAVTLASTSATGLDASTVPASLAGLALARRREIQAAEGSPHRLQRTIAK